jgi:hypothetical protein
VSLAQTPLLFPPFGLLPPSCSREGWGSSQGLRSFLEEVPRLLPLHTGGRDWVPPPIHFPPPLFLPGLRFESPSQGKNDHYIDEEVEALLAKGAIKEVPLSPPSLSYISPIFLVPKKDGGMRPILNFKRLNAAHLDTPHSRMETVEDIRHAFRPGDWATSIDLKDAYFHVPLHPSTWKYMRFCWKGGLSSSWSCPSACHQPSKSSCPSPEL